MNGSIKKLRQIASNKRLLCVGMDPSPIYWPQHIPNNLLGLEQFCIDVLEATYEYCDAYKFNLAFFEVWGGKGLLLLEKILLQLENKFLIADAKRSDIGHSAQFYAKAYFETFPFDAVTVNPYMGKDSVEPFLAYSEKLTFLLALTSNAGAEDFQMEGTPPLYEQVIQKAVAWNEHHNIGFVMGATRPNAIQKLRSLFPTAPLLVPGIGAQQGDLASTLKYAYLPNTPTLITVSRAIIYADNSTHYKKIISQQTLNYQSQIVSILNELPGS